MRKTRSILEFLATNYGLFFVVDKSNNGGSNDLRELIDQDILNIGNQYEASTKLYQEFENMINLRILLLCILKERFNDLRFGPLHWTFIQEYPSRFFGYDVFAYMRRHFYLYMLHSYTSQTDLVFAKDAIGFESALSTLSTETSVQDAAENGLTILAPSKDFPVFVDEIQTMMTLLKDRCLSFSRLCDDVDGKRTSSAGIASLLFAMQNIQKNIRYAKYQW